MKKGALRPEVYEDVRDIWRTKEAEKTGIDVDDQRLHNLSMTEGWYLLKQHIDNLKIGLDKRLSQSVLNSLGDAQIKTDAVFTVLGKELLDSIITKVEDSASVVEEIQNDKRRQTESK